jgi:hypothetical protein
MTSCCGWRARSNGRLGERAEEAQVLADLRRCSSLKSPARCGGSRTWISYCCRGGGRPRPSSGFGLRSPPPWRSTMDTLPLNTQRRQHALFYILCGRLLLRVGVLGSVGPLCLLANGEEGGVGAWLLCKNTAAGVRERGGAASRVSAQGEGKRPGRGRRRARSSPYGVAPPSATHVRRKRRRANDDMKCLFCPRPVSKLRGRHRISLLPGYKHTAQQRVSLTDEWAT